MMIKRSITVMTERIEDSPHQDFRGPRELSIDSIRNPPMVKCI